MEESEFDPFADLSVSEQQDLEQRTQQYCAQKQRKLDQLSNDPCKRTLQQNRWLFLQQRHTHFSTPQHHPHLLTHHQCQQILGYCQSMVEEEWSTARHSAFATTDIPVLKGPLAVWGDLVRQHLFPLLASHYGFHPTRDLDFKDLFIVKYDAQGQAGLGLHSDGCLLSFNILLNVKDDFEGGGTYFQSADTIIEGEQGDCVFHSAHVLHCGVAISKGHRYVLVGFIDTKDTLEEQKNR
ncbi:hypothetical protein BDF14DRAFT_1885341 [Spinellus fusiger]|nr:hypothetical protein BDF14DRAFT_1885341 [Spinellus fusiger]